ncbi:hypothetical protein KC348_g82 [Hortaea werneckii]|nr:hypothetical protein KC348_g82 [Hortaea werneckii]
MTASFSVISVTRPRVPSEPTKSPHDRKVDYPVFHRAIPYSIRPRAARADHTSDHSTRAGIYREEETRILDLVIQTHPSNCRLAGKVHVIRPELEELVHEAEIDADATKGS